MRSLFSDFFVVTLFTCLCVQYASCLRCYECGTSSWPYEQSCDEAHLLSPIMIKQCPDSRSMCFKVEKRVGDYRRVVRKCGVVSQLEQQSYDNVESKATSKDMSEAVYACKTDLCNGAAGVIPSTIMIWFISAVLSIYFSCT